VDTTGEVLDQAALAGLDEIFAGGPTPVEGGANLDD
jgi:hypothetical protein